MPPPTQAVDHGFRAEFPQNLQSTEIITWWSRKNIKINTILITKTLQKENCENSLNIDKKTAKMKLNGENIIGRKSKLTVPGT